MQKMSASHSIRNVMKAIAALLVAWIAYEYHDLFVSKPRFRYQNSIVEDDGNSQISLFQLTMPCITWADGLSADDACEDQFNSLEDLVRTNYFEDATRATYLYGAPSNINFMSAEIHTRSSAQETMVVSYSGPIVAVADSTAAALMVENLRDMIGGDPILYPMALPKGPLLKGSMKYRRGTLSSYKANYHLLTAQDDVSVIATAAAHGHVLDRKSFATVFLEVVSKRSPLTENIRYVDLILYVES